MAVFGVLDRGALRNPPRVPPPSSIAFGFYFRFPYKYVESEILRNYTRQIAKYNRLYSY